MVFAFNVAILVYRLQLKLFPIGVMRNIFFNNKEGVMIAESTNYHGHKNK